MMPQEHSQPAKSDGAPSHQPAIGDLPAAGLDGSARLPALAVCAGLLLLVSIGFGQATGFDFIILDDKPCVYDNSHVSGGLSVKEIGWAFSNRDLGIWDPLVWLSHMLDFQLYGMSAGGHHLTNILLHAAASILLFLVLRRMTARPWPAALAATLFAVHPLRVESVAWVTERKDVLSGVFFMLTLWAYTSYAQHGTHVKPGCGPARRRLPSLSYLAVLAFFAMGLMSKPSLVAMPLLLPLLDYWPLGRFNWRESAAGAGSSGRHPRRWLGIASVQPLWAVLRRNLHLASEKIVVVAMSAAMCVVTLWAESNALGANEKFPLWWRMGNATIGYANYLVQFFCPVGLSLAYPRAEVELPMAKVAASLLLLIAITTTALFLRRKCPYLLVGWLWYLVMFLPMIGLVQFGIQAEADRFTYLPQIGICIALAWTVADLYGVCRRRAWRPAAATVGLTTALSVAVLVPLTRQQTSHWRDSETLWRHALTCNPHNTIASDSLAAFLEDHHRLDEAITQCRRSVASNPQSPEAENNLGLALAKRGRPAEAIPHYRRALHLRPELVQAENNWGHALALQGDYQEAIPHYLRALDRRAGFSEARYNLGNALAARGQLDGAINQYRLALKIKPEFAEAYGNLANALARKRRMDDAIANYRKALALKPDDAKARNNLGVALGACHRMHEAIAEYRRAIQAKPDFVDAYCNLADTLAQVGDLDGAIGAYRMALEFKPDDAQARNDLQKTLQRAGRPLHRDGIGAAAK
ncbi:MAG: tetratricopeptide repeat protein [Thermoguttaceae bacterium]